MAETADRRLAQAVYLLAAVAALALYVLGLSLSPATANHDVGWTIYAGGQLLDGARFGQDLIDNNPPLIYWMSAIVNGLARSTGVPVFVAYNLTALMLILWCAYLCWRLLEDTVPLPDLRASLGVVLGGAPVVLAGYDFAQRDQLIAALLLPYIISVGLIVGGRPPRNGLRVAVGLASGLALSLKPHYVLVWLAIEVMIVALSPNRFQRRLTEWSRIENWVMITIGISYVASVLILAPGYVETIQETLAVYHAYDNEVPWISRRASVIGLAVVVLALARPRKALGVSSIAAVLAALVSLAVVVLQNKGFSYHFIPMTVMAYSAIILALADRLLRAEREGVRDVVNARRRMPLLVLFALVVAVGASWVSRTQYRTRTELAAVIAEHGGGQPILYFSSSVGPLFPSLVFTDSVSASPYSCLWLIAGNYSTEELAQRPFPYRALEEMNELERQFVTRIVDAMESQVPSLVFFERRGFKQSFGNSAFEFERYFMADPRFLRLMSKYRRLGFLGSAEAYGLVGDESLADRSTDRSIRGAGR